MLSVVMASYLGKYSGAAKDRERKFLRAVDSCLSQSYEDFELVIVSDGCDRTAEITPSEPRISLYRIDKQRLWSPIVRNTGIHYAQGQWIVYLDTDDQFGPGHLKTIAEQLDNSVTWAVFNDFIWSLKTWKEREVDTGKKFRCGTSNLVHKAGIYWPEDAADYEHDWKFIAALRMLGEPKKLATAHYLVSHIPNRYDV
jgi:glycosyltransferase involved in cell wall biosynthesis